MQIPPLYSAAWRRRGFTLVELLVVIVIIAVLAALLFSVGSTIQNRAGKVQAINDMRNMRVSMISYYTDYRRYPLNDVQRSATAAGGYDTIYGDPGGLYTSADLFDILRAVADNNFNEGNKLNPNQVVYWEGQFAKSVSNPRSGITTQDFTDDGNVVPKGSFLDPWGNSYLVWIDANNDGDLSVAAHWFYSDIRTMDTNGIADVLCGTAPMGIEFSSLGPDGAWGTKGNYVLKGSDDIVTW